MGTMPGDILDVIDGALTDYSVSRDAMRWNPDSGGEESAPVSGDGYTRSGTGPQDWSAAEFILAALPPAATDVRLDLWEPFPPFLGAMQAGEVIIFRGQQWRITRRREMEPFQITFDLEPFQVCGRQLAVMGTDGSIACHEPAGHGGMCIGTATWTE